MPRPRADQCTTLNARGRRRSLSQQATYDTAGSQGQCRRAGVGDARARLLSERPHDACVVGALEEQQKHNERSAAECEGEQQLPAPREMMFSDLQVHAPRSAALPLIEPGPVALAWLPALGQLGRNLQRLNHHRGRAR